MIQAMSFMRSIIIEEDQRKLIRLLSIGWNCYGLHLTNVGRRPSKNHWNKLCIPEHVSYMFAIKSSFRCYLLSETIINNQDLTKSTSVKLTISQLYTLIIVECRGHRQHSNARTHSLLKNPPRYFQRSNFNQNQKMCLPFFRK